MTNEEKKFYLNQYLKCNDEVQDILEDMARARSEMQTVTSVISDMPRTGPLDLTNKLQAALERLEEIADKFNLVIVKRMRIKQEVRSAITSVGDKTLERLLTLRYISGYTWEQVAEKMTYNYRWVLRLHERALSKLAIESHTEKLINCK